jgi:hypothetical protein
VAIDVAADLRAIVASGDFPEATGTLTQGGEDYAFDEAIIVGRSRTQERGNVDREDMRLILVESGVSVQPYADAYLKFTGSDQHWHLLEVTPIAPGGTVAGWRITLSTKSRRDRDLA